ncbi:MAG: hypothetical protein ACE15B_17725 [Bryobacteraceae bacterium]
MIDSVLNLLFRCAHRRLTRPVTPVSRAGAPQGGTYVVCLDCGKQFAYDLKTMRIERHVRQSAEHGILPPDMPKRRSRMRYALWAGVPAALLLGAALRKPRAEAPPVKKDAKPGPAAR